MVLDSTPSGLRNTIAATRGRPARKRAYPGLNELNPFRIEEWILQRSETQIILIPLKTARNLFIKNKQSKNEPNFQPPSPTKVGRDIALRSPFLGEVGCPHTDGAARHP
jgi:hypothetical protein